MSVPVYFLPWSRSSELPLLLERSEAARVFSCGDMVAVKLHFGEKGNDGYIKPEFVRPVLKFLDSKKTLPFLTDTATIYTGQRTNAVHHLKIAAEHGFSQTRLHTPVIISDGLRGGDYESVPIPNGRHFKEVKIATGITAASSLMVLSHFKGHLMGGFGGAIKNLGMGCGSRLGKFEMHSSATPEVTGKLCTACGACIPFCAQKAISLPGDHVVIDTARCSGCGECVVACGQKALSVNWNEGPRTVQERYVEYALGAALGKRAFYVNFVNHITPNCDCLSKGETPMVPDIGIMASTDPVAIDQASYDKVLSAGAGDVFSAAHPNVDARIQLEHAAAMGLGSREYEFIAVE